MQCCESGSRKDSIAPRAFAVCTLRHAAVLCSRCRRFDSAKNVSVTAKWEKTYRVARGDLTNSYWQEWLNFRETVVRWKDASCLRLFFLSGKPNGDSHPVVPFFTSYVSPSPGRKHEWEVDSDWPALGSIFLKRKMNKRCQVEAHELGKHG